MLFAGCATSTEKVTSIYRLDGVEPVVYYTAPGALTEGYDGETAVIMIQGWHGGVQVLEEQLALQKALGDVYVISPMYQMVAQYGTTRGLWILPFRVCPMTIGEVEVMLTVQSLAHSILSTPSLIVFRTRTYSRISSASLWLDSRQVASLLVAMLLSARAKSVRASNSSMWQWLLRPSFDSNRTTLGTMDSKIVRATLAR